MRPAAVLPRAPGDRVRAEDWNQMQCKLEAAAGEHVHRVDASVLDESAQVRARHLRADALKVDGRPLEEPLVEGALAAGRGALKQRLPVEGGEILGDLSIAGDLNVRGDLVIDGKLSGGGDGARDERPLRRGTPRQLSAKGEYTVRGGNNIDVPMPGAELRFEIDTLTLATINLRGLIAPPQQALGERYSYGGYLGLSHGFTGSSADSIHTDINRTWRPARWLPRFGTELITTNSTWHIVYGTNYANGASTSRPWHEQNLGQQTRTFLLDPGAWTFQVRVTSLGGTRFEASMDIFLLPLPELAP